jgi:hypothetical protein
MLIRVPSAYDVRVRYPYYHIIKWKLSPRRRSTMFRTLSILVAILSLIACISVSMNPNMALAGTEGTEHSTYVPATTFDSPCVGELINTTPDSIARITDIGDGKFHIVYTIGGVGQTTGRSYVINGGFNFTIAPGGAVTLVDRLITAGYEVSHSTYHINLDTRGEFSTDLSNIVSDRCVGKP